LPERKLTAKTVQTNLITGVLTLIPLLVVWLVLDFVLSFLFAVGSPFAAGVTMFITDRVPSAERLLDDPVFHWLVAVVVALVLLYFVGAITSRVMGKKLIAFVEGLIAHGHDHGPGDDHDRVRRRRRAGQFQRVSHGTYALLNAKMTAL